MSSPPPQLRTLLIEAAQLRAGGASWARVAERVGRDADTCRKWPRRYAATWFQLYRHAEHQVTAENAAIAQARLRQFLLCDNEQISERAVRFALTLNGRNLDRYSRERLARLAAQAKEDMPDRRQYEAFRAMMNMSEEQKQAMMD